MKKKKTIIIVGVICLVLVGVILLKAFYFNQPLETPKDITQNIVNYMQKKDKTDKDKEEIRKYYKNEVLEEFDSDMDSNDSDSDSDVIVNIEKVDEQKNTATSTIELKVAMFTLPIQFIFEKDGNFWTGHQWRISDIKGLDNNDSTKEDKKGKLNEKIDIGGEFELIVGNIEDYNPTSEWDKPKEGMKYVSTELTYFNNSKDSGDVSPSNLTLRDSEGHSYEMTYMSQKEPVLEAGTVVTPNNSVKGYVTYETPIDANITEAVYSNSSVTINIEI